ncbi:MAG: hypothetical protein WCL53_02435 [Chloroflexota bacterium]
MTNPAPDIERLELLRTVEALQRLAPDLRALLDEPELLEGLALPRYARTELWSDEEELPTTFSDDALEA